MDSEHCFTYFTLQFSLNDVVNLSNSELFSSKTVFRVYDPVPLECKLPFKKDLFFLYVIHPFGTVRKNYSK